MFRCVPIQHELHFFSPFAIGKHYLQSIPVYIKSSHQYRVTVTRVQLSKIHTHELTQYKKNNVKKLSPYIDVNLSGKISS